MGALAAVVILMGPNGRASTVAELAEAAHHPMSFTPITLCRPPQMCRPAVVAHGTIMGTTAADLRVYMDAHRARPPQVVVLDSIGGVFTTSVLTGLTVWHLTGPLIG